MTVANYTAEIQKLGLGAEVVLFQIDLTALGGPTLYYTPATADGHTYSSISYGGQAYTPFPIQATGFAWEGMHSPPLPTVTVSNINHAFTSYILNYGSLIGGKFKRIRTFEKFLDGGATPDGTANMPIDVFRIDKKTGHNDEQITWELASWIDQQGVQLPKRICVRDYCYLQYRNGSSGTFDYSKADCPYTGAAMFDVTDTSTATVSNDICSHTLAGCKARYGTTATLPFGGFPGVPKFKLQ